MITQKKIAELAGVSRATVDRVLNDRDGVNDDTRKKIMEIAKAVGYKPNRAGKALAIRQKHIQIGCILIDAKNPFYADIKKGIENKKKEYDEYGITVAIRMVKLDVDAQISVIEGLVKEGISALVIQPVNSPLIARKLQELSDKGVLIVTTNSDVDGFESFAYVGNNFYACGKMAANLMELITHGNANIGIVTGFFGAKSHGDRIDGFKAYIKDYKRMNIIETIENHDDEFESYHLTYDMLSRHPEIDSIFIVAGGVYGAGRAVKEFLKNRKITVISFDDVPTTKELIKEDVIAATICQQPVRQGELSLEVILNYLIDNERPQKREIDTDIEIKIKTNIEI